MTKEAAKGGARRTRWWGEKRKRPNGAAQEQLLRKAYPAASAFNVICIKWGTRYAAFYVNRLFAMVSRNLAEPFRFVCFTDDCSGIDPRIECFAIPSIRLPAHTSGGWCKLALLAPELGDLRGSALFLDLDVVITGDLRCFFEHAGELCIIRNWSQPGKDIGNSSVFRFEVGSLKNLYAQFNTDPNGFSKIYSNEQTYLSLADRTIRKTFWPDAWVKSFKLHSMPTIFFRHVQTPFIPQGARIMVFHGNPKMEEAARGKSPWDRRNHHKRSVPMFWREVPWIDELWREDCGTVLSETARCQRWPLSNWSPLSLNWKREAGNGFDDRIVNR